MSSQNTGVGDELIVEVTQVKQALNNHEKDCEQRQKRTDDQFKEVKSDLKEVKSDLKSDLRDVKSDLKSDIKSQTTGLMWALTFAVAVLMAGTSYLNSRNPSEKSGPNVYQKVAYESSILQSTGNWEEDKAWLERNHAELTHGQIMKFVSTMPDSVQQQAMKWLEQQNPKNVHIQSATATLQNQ